MLAAAEDHSNLCNALNAELAEAEACGVARRCMLRLLEMMILPHCGAKRNRRCSQQLSLTGVDSNDLTSSIIESCLAVLLHKRGRP